MIIDIEKFIEEDVISLVQHIEADKRMLHKRLALAKQACNNLECSLPDAERQIAFEKIWDIETKYPLY
jgi:hypothetical protein